MPMLAMTLSVCVDSYFSEISIILNLQNKFCHVLNIAEEFYIAYLARVEKNQNHFCSFVITGFKHIWK